MKTIDTAEALAQIALLLDGVDHAARAQLSHPERLNLVTNVRAVANRIEALVGVLISEADQAGSSMAVRGTPTTTWLGLSGQASAAEAASLVFTGRDLAAHPAARDAALAGRIGAKQVRAVHTAMNELPDDLGAEQRAAAEQLLVAQAERTPAKRVAAAAPAVLAAVAPDHPDLGVENQLAALDAQRKRAQSRRALTFSSDGDGSTLLRGSLPTLDAAPLIKLIEAYTESDRRRGRDRLDRLSESRTPEQRRADALLALVTQHQLDRRAPAVAGDRPRVVVTMRERELRELAEQHGVLDAGQAISAGELRRLCCDADLVPAVLGAKSEVLDIGRAQRLVSPAIRRALSIRDGGCVFPGCEVPDARCEAHHIVAWYAGGRSSMANLVLLCPHHHQLLEPLRFFTGPPPDRWQIRLDADGLPEVLPPARVDAERKPIPARRGPTLARAG